ncbi:hypothetical protein B6U67_00785 [Methanosarcinales archaeon ex4484_138]|nr:MAG: hypothetical protein B6U67_00785 [Methanosarcinales archaeon ex4484_138]
MADETGDQVNENLPEKISNISILNFLHHLRDAHYEVGKCASSGQTDGFTVEADLKRLKDMIADLHKLWEFICLEPSLDCPESSHTIYYEVPKIDVITPTPENRDIQYILMYIKMMYMEMANSQSARLVTGLQPADKERGKAYLDRIDVFVKDYLETNTPNDFPKATPEEPTPTPGRLGA